MEGASVGSPVSYADNENQTQKINLHKLTYQVWVLVEEWMGLMLVPELDHRLEKLLMEMLKISLTV